LTITMASEWLPKPNFYSNSIVAAAIDFSK
jgi:hypothetical protein